MATSNFEVKDFDLLIRSMLNYIYYSDNSLTDFNVGAVFRSILGAVAQEEEETYFRLWQGIQKAIQLSILTSFNFTPEVGKFSSGMVAFGRDSEAVKPLLVPANTYISSPSGKLYRTIADALLAIDNTQVEVQVIAINAGSKFNLITTNTRLQMVNPIYGISWVTNITPISGGTDIESNAELFQRFAQYISSLSRGTKVAIRYGAMLAEVVDNTGNVLEKVGKCKVYDYPDNMGYVDCYIDNGSGTTSQSLVAASQKLVDGWIDQDNTIHEGWKAAGVSVRVQEASPIPLNVVIYAAAQDFYRAEPYISATVEYYFNSLNIGQVLNYEKLLSDCFSSDTGIIDLEFMYPVGDVHISPNEIIILGTLQILPMAAHDANLP